MCAVVEAFSLTLHALLQLLPSSCSRLEPRVVQEQALQVLLLLLLLLPLLLLLRLLPLLLHYSCCCPQSSTTSSRLCRCMAVRAPRQLLQQFGLHIEAGE